MLIVSLPGLRSMFRWLPSGCTMVKAASIPTKDTASSKAGMLETLVCVGFVLHAEQEIGLVRESGHAFSFDVGHGSMRLEGISKKCSHAVAAAGSTTHTVCSESGPSASGVGPTDTRRCELGSWIGVIAKESH